MSKMPRGSACAIALSSLLALSPALGGCTSKNSAPGSGSDMGSTAMAEKPAEKTLRQKAAEAYAAELASPQNRFMDLDSSAIDTASYSYALVDMTDFETPLLLLRASGPADTWGGVDAVRVIGYDTETDGTIAYEGSLSQGVAGVGGYRGTLSASAGGDGLIYEEISSGTGALAAYRVRPEGSALAQSIIHIGTFGIDTPCNAPLAAEVQDISWTDAGDASALDALADGTRTSTITAPGADWAAKAEEAGLSAYTGTLHVLDAEGVANLQGMDRNPYAGHNDDTTYVVLELDGTQAVTARSEMDTRTDEASLVALKPATTGSGDSTAWSADQWSALDGKQVKVAINPDKTWWPSDAGLPIGAPYSQDFLILAS